MAGMRKGFCGIIVAALIFAGIGVLPALAGTACLAVVNTTSQSFSFTVDGWNQYNWTWRPNEELTYVSFNGTDIKSPNSDNSFMVRGALGNTVTKDNAKFDWRPDLTGGRGQTGTCGGTWVMTIMNPGGVTTPVPPSGDSGMNYDHPGSCLYVKNTQSFLITLKLAHPSGYENVHWDYPAGDNALVASGSPVKTPDGGWSVTMSNGIRGTWSWDPSYTQHGCDGQWVLTM
jgi:hypothetical protein